MSLERDHPVFLGHPSRDRTPPRYKNRFLDDEIGARTFQWMSRRCICILGDQNTGRRSLAKRFFEDHGELRVNGNWWLRGFINSANARPSARGELDLLIRIVPSPEEVLARDGRTLIAAGLHGNSALFIFAFVCAKLRSLRSIQFLISLLWSCMVRNEIPALLVGTKSDLRPEDLDERIFAYLSEATIRREMEGYFRALIRRTYCLTPPYEECSVLNNENVHTIINIALDKIGW